MLDQSWINPESNPPKDGRAMYIIDIDVNVYLSIYTQLAAAYSQPSSCPPHSVLYSFDPLRQHGNAMAQATAAPSAAH